MSCASMSCKATAHCWPPSLAPKSRLCEISRVAISRQPRVPQFHTRVGQVRRFRGDRPSARSPGATLAAERVQVALRVLFAELRRLAEEALGFAIVSRNPKTIHVHNAQVVRGPRMSELGGLAVEPQRFAIVFRDADAILK